MKKGIYILVAVVAVLAIAMVAFLGTKPVGIILTTYISQIEIMDRDGNSVPYNQRGNRVLEIDFQVDAKDQAKGIEYMYYPFDTSIKPEIVTSRSFVYYCAQDSYVSFGEISNNAPAESSAATNNNQSNSTGRMLIRREVTDPNTIHYVDIFCKADDGGKAGVEDQIGVLIHFNVA
jgi:hypothetical protein